MKILIAVVLATVCVVAQAASGVIQGTVVDAAQQPVSGGSIEITINGAAAGSTPIGANGAFDTTATWIGSAPARCDLHSIVAGFVDQTMTVLLPAGGTVNAQFTLVLDEKIFADGFEPSPGT